ncbi:lyase [Sphingomonas sp. A2-49]|uniref:lyase n=1 Tax=Sphingomonas sp. A2-49 TaxID=1391375 RepID=UPI0021CEB66C|nr:lyase [Sphingomonas sp. A2-49]MCU6453914.1 lyase [Sphingomonas sp. A2-49]
MTEHYEPASDFLKAVAAEEVPLAGSSFADANLRRLIAMTRDDDVSNRDWATMLLASEESDTSEIREALLSAANDENDVVREEALVGIARRDRALALPLVLEALSGDSAGMPLFEAAALVADPALVGVLRPWTERSDDEWLDQLAFDALAACENSQPTP